MGRNVFRVLLSGIWALLIAAIGVVASPNLEELARSCGYATVLAGVYAHVSVYAPLQWILLALAFCSGAMLIAWGEVLLHYARKKSAIYRVARASIKYVDSSIHKADRVHKDGLKFLCTIEGPMLGKIYDSEPDVSDFIQTIMMIFENDIDTPSISVFSDRTVIWRAAEINDRYIIIELDMRTDTAVTIDIIVRPEAWGSSGRWAPRLLTWEDSHIVDETKLNDGLIQPPFTARFINRISR